MKLEIYEQQGKTGYIKPAPDTSQRTFTWKYTGDNDQIKTALMGFEQVETVSPKQPYNEDVFTEFTEEVQPENYERYLLYSGEYLMSAFVEIWEVDLVK